MLLNIETKHIDNDPEGQENDNFIILRILLADGDIPYQIFKVGDNRAEIANRLISLAKQLRDGV